MQKPHALSPGNQKVLDLLTQAKKPLSAYDILDKLRRFGVRSPPTVYRALDYLTKHGFIHRIESLNAFVVCKHDENDHAHDHVSQFAICTSCGSVEEIEDPNIAKTIQKLGAKFLKKIEQETLEIKGTCRDCSTESHAGH